MNDDLLHSLLQDIKCDVCDLTRMMRGDGTDSNPGVLIKLDRLAIHHQEEKGRRQKAEARLWTALSGMVVAAFAALLGWIHPPGP